MTLHPFDLLYTTRIRFSCIISYVVVWVSSLFILVLYLNLVLLVSVSGLFSVLWVEIHFPYSGVLLTSEFLDVSCCIWRFHRLCVLLNTSSLFFSSPFLTVCPTLICCICALLPYLDWHSGLDPRLPLTSEFAPKINCYAEPALSCLHVGPRPWFLVLQVLNLIQYTCYVTKLRRSP